MRNILPMSIAAMKLADWLRANKMLKGTFAERVGVGAPTISRLLNGERTPSLDLAARISQETDGIVTPSDWVTPFQRRDEENVVAA